MSARRSAQLAERLVGWIQRFPGRRVSVLGDLVADEFVYGDIARVSREAPVLILEHQRTDTAPGGAANGAANLHALGAQPIPVGVVGDDDAGNRLLENFRRMKSPTSGVLKIRGYQTPSKSRILAGGVHTRRQQLVRLDRGSPRGEFPPKTRTALRRALRKALARSDGLLVADYGYGSASPQLLGSLRPRRGRRFLPVTVDSRARVNEFSNITACTPNQEELEQVVGGEPLAGDREVADAGRALLLRTSAQAVLVTRGARGMCLFERRRRAVQIPAFGSEEVADVTGAGDTVIAVFTLALIVGADALDAARLANYAAGLVVRKAGTATVDRGELLRAVRQDLET